MIDPLSSCMLGKILLNHFKGSNMLKTLHADICWFIYFVPVVLSREVQLYHLSPQLSSSCHCTFEVHTGGGGVVEWWGIAEEGCRNMGWRELVTADCQSHGTDSKDTHANTVRVCTHANTLSDESDGNELLKRERLLLYIFRHRCTRRGFFFRKHLFSDRSLVCTFGNVKRTKKG